MLNSSILSLIWSGTAYFVVNYTNTFLPGNSDRRASFKRGRPLLSAKPKAWRHQMFLFSLLLIWYIFVIINPFSWITNAVIAVSNEKHCPSLMAFKHQANWCTNFLRFQGAQPDHQRVESSSCCFPRALVSFVCPKELVSFDPPHVTCSSPIWKRIWVARYNSAIHTMP